MLLATLPEQERRDVLASMERVHVRAGEVLLWPSDPLTRVYFPEDGLISLLITVYGGRSIEVFMVGREGMVGAPAVLGARTVIFRAVCQMDATLLALSVTKLQQLMDRCPTFRRLLLRYTEAMLANVMRMVACNALHSVEQRCARWLLIASDRAADSPLHLTHEMLAEMLAVRRATVTEVMHAFHRRRLVEYARGRVTILDRERLQEVTCECYGVMATALAVALGQSHTARRPPTPRRVR